MSDYRNMTYRDLDDELKSCLAIVQAPEGPSSPTNGARRAAERHIEEIEFWYARRAEQWNWKENQNDRLR